MDSHTGNLTRFSALVDRIYAGALDPNLWPEVTVGIAEWIDATKALLFTPLHPKESNGLLFSHGFEERGLELWRTKFQPMDVWAGRALEAGLFLEGNCAIGTDLVPEAELKSTPWYQGFLKDQDILQLITGAIFDGRTAGTLPTICSCFRSERQERFGPADLERYQLLVPHLSRALGVMYRLREADLRVAASLAALDRLPNGVLLIAPPGEVVFANRAAQRMLEADDGLQLKELRGSQASRLKAADTKAQAQIDQAVRASVTHDMMDIPHFAHSIAVPRPSGLAPYALQFSALPEQNEFGHGIAAPRAIVFVTDTTEAVPIAPEQLASLYDLTPAEARLAIALVQGGGLQEVADVLGISINTAKTQLQQVYAKTGTDSRAKLAKLLIALAAGTPS